MATLNEISYDLLSIVRPQLSDDNDIDIRQIKFWIRNQRSLWLRNELNKKRTIDEDIIQTLCVDIEEVDSSDCCDITIGCSVLRSKQKLPKVIELHNKNAIVRVGPVDRKGKPFSYIGYERVPWVGNGRFNQFLLYAFLYNEYMHILTNNSAYQDLKTIIIRGVFEHPEELAAFRTCEEQPCYSDDDEYPIKTWMIPALKESILKSNLLIEAQAESIADTSNNATSDVAPVGDGMPAQQRRRK